MIEQTLVLLKPDAVRRSLVGEIITRYDRANFRIAAAKMTQADTSLSRRHYADHVEKPFYAGLETVLTSGPLVAMVLEGIQAIAIIREMNGAMVPSKAAVGTIRRDYGDLSAANSDLNNPIWNLVHSSDSQENAVKEVRLWFTPEEMHSYAVAHDPRVL